MRKAILCFGLLLISLSIYSQNQNGGLLTDQQNQLLNKRYGSSMLENSTFDSYCSYLFAFMNVSIHTNSHEVASMPLMNVFPPKYKPTLKEIFDTIAYQTNTAWNYDPSTGYWLFTESEDNIPFSIETAPGWRMEHRGVYVWFAPTIAEMGMDIYILGHYSTEDKDLLTLIRNMWAERSASGFNPEISANDMKLITINGNEAIYYEQKIRNEATWRQWFIFIDSNLYGIVSAIQFENDSVLYENVVSMINSLQTRK